MAQIAVAH